MLLMSEVSFAVRELMHLSVASIVVSSAYKKGSELATQSGRSFMYNKKRRGPSIEPWGTPLSVVLKFERFCETQTA